MKVLFMGTPEFAVPSLTALLASRNHTVAGAVTQPDRALKHGKTEVGAVKACAQAAGLRVIQPVRIRDAVEEIKSFGADIAVTAAYGQLLTQSVIDAFPNGIINVHASLLPAYRGASPIAAAIANGEKRTGVTIMRTELGLDTGDIISAVETEIGDTETAGELTARLAELGARLLIDTLDNFGNIKPVKQDEQRATHCRTIKKDELFIDYTLGAKTVSDKIRALSPTPCAKTVICGESYKIYGALPIENTIKPSAAPGEILRCDSRLIVACADGAIEVTRLQASSKRALDISEFLHGKRFKVGELCGKA